MLHGHGFSLNCILDETELTRVKLTHENIFRNKNDLPFFYVTFSFARFWSSFEAILASFRFQVSAVYNTYQLQTWSRAKQLKLTDQIQSSKNSRTLSGIGRLSCNSTPLKNKAEYSHDCQNFPPSSSSNNYKSVISREESEPRELWEGSLLEKARK